MKIKLDVGQATRHPLSMPAVATRTETALAYLAHFAAVTIALFTLVTVL